MNHQPQSSKLTLPFYILFLLSLSIYTLSENGSKDEMKNASSEQIERGKYLAQMGDCAGCHTTKNGIENTGGLPFITPFGVLYSTNITPDDETGIGRYNYDDFYNAMHKGVAPGGNLYPAMPYTSYHLLSDGDTQDLFAYFMSLKPVHHENLDNDLSFPFNMRFGLKIWNALSHSDEEFQLIETKSALWNRGAYIVNVLGHCGECHTPRSTFFAMEPDKHFQGAIIEGYEASNITPQELNRQNWTHEDLSDLLSKGYSRKGTIFGGMYPVVYHSFKYLSENDMKAVTTYLLDNEQYIDPQSLTFNQHKAEHPGYDLYMGYCAGCHGHQGDGIPNTAPGLKGNTTLDRKNPHNTLAILLKGIPRQYFDVDRAFYKMPGYENTLSDQELIHLTQYLRSTFTTQKSDVSQDHINQVKESLQDHALHE